MIYPTVHLNGTSRNELMSGFESAARGVNDALRALQDAAPNARDYYPQGDGAFKIATTEHVARMAKLQDVLAELSDLLEKTCDP